MGTGGIAGGPSEHGPWNTPLRAALRPPALHLAHEGGHKIRMEGPAARSVLCGRLRVPPVSPPPPPAQEQHGAAAQLRVQQLEAAVAAAGAQVREGCHGGKVRGNECHV